MSNYIEDGKIWAYYDVTTTESATTLIGATTGIGGTMNVDGVNVTRATSYTFGTTGIHLVKFTPTTTYIGRSVFRNIARIVELYLPSSITRTDGANESVNCINGCANLVTIGLSTSFKNVYAHDFKNLSSLTEIKNYEVIRTIGNYAFQSLPNWNVELNLPNMTSLGDRAFQASGITKILNLGSITTIPGGANESNAPFLNCSKLTEATLPATLTTITQFSFYNCSKLKRLTMLSVNPPSLGSNAFRGTTSLDAILVPADSVDAYKAASGWSYWSSKIFPIGDTKRLSINHLSLGDFRRRIMIGISRPSGYPDPWVDDGKIWAYYNVTDTEAATSLLYTSSTVSAMEVDGVPVTVATSYQFATTGEHLVKFTMSGSTIPNRFMRERTALVRIYFPDDITDFAGSNGAHFFYCTGLTFVRFPANLTNISYQCFTGCTNLVIKNLSLPHITSIGSNGFWRVKITNIVDLGEITVITANYIFANNSSLKTVILPSAITGIGNNAFNSCGTVDSFTCLAVTPPSLGSGVFQSTTLTKIYVPAGSVQAYKEASGWSSYASKIEAIPTT